MIKAMKINAIYFNYQNIQISTEMKSLLEKMLKYNSKDRITWKEMYEHPIFKKYGYDKQA